MQSFGFKVIPSDPEDASGVPISVAGQTMVDIQGLITDIGCMFLRISMRIQNGIPADLKKKFDLTIGGTSAGIGSGPSKGNEMTMERVVNTLCSTLDFLGTGAIGTWMEDTFEDNEARSEIAKKLIALNDHLQGYKLIYGVEGNEKEFTGLDKEKVSVYINTAAPKVATIGILVRDEIRRNHWNLFNDNYLVPVTFARNISSADIPVFASSGPIFVIGDTKRNSEGHVISVDGIDGCYGIPQVKVYRVITSGSDRNLLNPLIVQTTYDPSKDMWYARNEYLGIDVSKASWDECMVSLHEYIEFLFETYVDDEGPFDGEEQEVREFLLSLLPA